ncbi:TDP-N-acetylfucosamine:lipid II N-acetylfucosaminyltransferase [Cytobacillus sp. S13-E01]|uniref:TDP-N-acetylfucosamine:lipid II N-acetylfucosaminyltransferase n=1 Tax=Cytobacillus sp. S13-E01 TaxID=3031326 RepID=UPI0023D7CB95|nr:TDP-N-acetylfucosamine:lipid II N-acetylfucosaminyltransferase [Cytobacillus sp. S13-E01]MDF0727065.1 TDP-N-acetylfucosamine:lipid II N-acetylfucosaminyltransferase [Cytobacillus sp. S13-E01]
MINLHIMSNDKFTEPFIDFINKNFNSDEHFFLVYGKGDGKNINPRENVLNLSLNIKSLLILNDQMNKSNKTLIHGLNSSKLLYMLYFQPWLLKKCNWIVFGGDLYSYRHESSDIKSKIVEMMRRQVIRNMGFITTLVRGDYDLALEWYGTKAKYQHGAYINPISLKYLDSLQPSCKSNSDTINIQVGNSGDPSNQHIQVIRSLKKFTHEDIKIYLPLSYGGTKEYIYEVIEYGKEIFGDKFVPLLEFLKPEEYAQYLSSIDLAIFNHNRQQGLFNIIALLYLDKKVYIRNDISSWDYFISSLEASIYNTLDLEEVNFNEFKTNHKNQNTLKMKKLFNDQNLINVWKKIFEGVR